MTLADKMGLGERVLYEVWAVGHKTDPINYHDNIWVRCKSLADAEDISVGPYYSREIVKITTKRELLGGSK